MLPLKAIRTAFDAGAAQVIFLALNRLSEPPEEILSAHEVARARRLVAAPVRRGFTAGRWLVRSVLAALTGERPEALELQSGAHGKLFLVGRERLAPCFNLSHSGDLVALALVRQGRIGIDIEAERPLTDSALLARRILAPRERAWFESLPESAREAGLLVAWTRKEAVLKAVGTGISGNLRSIEVLPEAEGRAVIHAADSSASWSVRALAMPPGFHGAIAIEGEARPVVTWQAIPA
jgi:4'-phosphopantetheinyl transferase